MARALFSACLLLAACSAPDAGAPSAGDGGSGAAGGGNPQGGAATTGGLGSGGDAGGGQTPGGSGTTAGSDAGGGQPPAGGSGGQATGGSDDPPPDICSTPAPSGELSAAWQSYAETPNAHANIPNIGYAGYRLGEAPLPEGSGAIIDVKAAHGAKGDGQSDDTAALRAALAAVPEGGAVVFLPAGEYALSGPLFVHQRGTILRGESRDGTRLRFTRSLEQGYAINRKSDTNQSRWSWSGGMLWFGPQSKNSYLNGVPNIGNTFSEDWNVGAELTRVAQPAQRGATSVTVQDAAGLQAGQYVFIRIDNAADLSVVKHMTGDGAWANAYDWSPGNSQRVLAAGTPEIVWPVQVKGVSGQSVELAQPLRFDLRAAWNPTVHAAGDVLREVGVENLTVSLARNYNWSFGANHNLEPGWNGVWFNNVIDGFLRGVTVIDSDHGIGVSASKNITLTDFKLDGSSAARRVHHHATTMRVMSHDILWENFEISSQPFHGINTEGFSMGGVWSKGNMAHGTFDTHRNLPLDCVHTEITVNNDGSRGGAADAGPTMGARFVNWNIQVDNNRAHMITEANIMPSGAVVGVRGPAVTSAGNSACLVEASGPSGAVPNPPNLYDAQLRLRLCGP